ncbi:uncharacterized protein LOC110166517 [Boleophthalmus pectinirostris]|uniref:uncharacterized protein LOC110166517 n=1 Tax=Boleophthalmus pectinirostris TaxID=150288 RepID=UPI000A1C6685|nr:uncharacterized protein LOC110166517 [Boleophthalmus pectinirostris]XP_055018724.1 uncharacterized protein LOC110166517 [Boleophthalmus pectinirostris]XP_055018725.1 uncharacterized protein LOC110166517 [Boleophthalmus pectinirostris]
MSVTRSVCSALWGMCAGDAMAMPVHWFYHVDHIKSQFGSWISDFKAPKETHPSSIMSLSNPAGSGRTSSLSPKEPDVIGTIILHNKLHLWRDPSGTVHYHQGLDAGDNTLNVLVSLRAGLSLVQTGFRDCSSPEARAVVLRDYVDFMTTPASHRDSYAESWHRDFFKDWSLDRPTSPEQILNFAEARSRRKLKSRPDSQLDAIGCLPMILPFVLLSASANQETAVRAAVEMATLTHPHPNALHTVALYAKTLHAVVGGACLREQSEHALKALGQWETSVRYSKQAQRFPVGSEQRLRVHQRAVGELGLACYSSGALSSLFHLAHEFHDDPVGGILTNTNCGGENCSRGAALGALLWASAARRDQPLPQTWTRAMRDAQDLVPQIVQGLDLD